MCVVYAFFARAKGRGKIEKLERNKHVLVGNDYNDKTLIGRSMIITMEDSTALTEYEVDLCVLTKENIL